MSMEEASFLQQPSENVTEYTLITQVGEDGMHHATILQQVGEDGSGPTVVQLEQLPAGTQEQIQAQLVQSLVQNGQLHQQVMVEQPSTTLELLPSVSMGEVHEVPVTMPVVSIGMANEPDAIVESPVPVGLPRPSDVKPPVGKGPFKCDVCGKMLQRWAQLQRHLRQHEDDKPFRCNQCDLTFNVEDNLHLHMAIHNTENPMCPECGKKFSRIASLKAHIMLHEREENVMCPECGDEFPVQSQLDRHIQEHREEQEGTRVYPCKQCGMEFSKLTLLREHMKVHYKIRNSLHHRSYKRQIDRTNFHHKCKYCGKTFLKPSQLDRHVRIHTGERPYKCSICEKAFNQKGALQIHMSKHTGDRPFSCDFCPMTFAQRGNLRAHILRVHSHPKDSDAPVYQCEECSCAFKKLGSLNAHVSRTHSDPQTIKVPSEPQKETIVHKQNVNDVIQHLLEMSEQVPEAAAAGGAQNLTEQNNSDILRQALENSGLPSTQKEGQQSMTTTPVTMDTSSINTVAASSSAPQLASVTGTPGTLSGGFIESHTVTMSIHDSATGTVKKHVIRKVNGVRWHQCMYCSKEFKKPSDLVRHIRIHTHEKPYKCNQCFRAFAVKSTLTAHLKTHTGIKEFKCHVCDKHFATQGSLKVHLRLHTGAKPFDCPHCDKKFRTSGHRKSHIQSHFKSPELEKGGKRLIRRASKPDIPLPDIPLQEPILITDTGLIQQPPRQNQIFSHYLGEVGSVDRPYKCQTCLRSFKKSSHLKQHIRSHTGEKPYQCLQCLKSFVSSGVLKAHIRTHSGVKAYKCLICNSTFTTSGSLKRHMSTHSEVRPFMCPYCQKTFKTSVNCKKHMKTHRHDLALQAMQQGDENVQPGSEGAEVTEAPEETVEHVTHDNNTITLQTVTTDDDGNTTTTEITTVPQEAQLETDNLGQEQTLQQTVQQELTPDLTNTTLTQQNVIQESIVDHQLTNTLGSQNGFGQQQTLNQTLLGGSQAFSDLNLSSGQFTIQGIQTSLDVGGLVNLSQQVSGINTSMASTSMQNILQTSDTQSQQQQTTYRASENIPLDIPDGKRNYNCDLCKKSFKKSSHLKAHLRTHTGEKPYNCIQCGRKFVSMGVLKAHLKTHSGMKEHICTVCQASFTTNGSLTRHMMIHSSVRPFQCPICQERFRTLTLCKRHIKGHKEGDDDMDKSLGRRSRPVITLSEEQAEQLSRAPLDEHMSVSEQILIQSAAEKDRVSEIPGPTTLDKHPKFPHQCQHCPKSFKKPSDLVRHVRIHTGEKPFSCDTCGRSFTVKSTLETHLLTHKGTEKRFKCHVCNSAFSTKGSLKVHMRLHTGAKPFKCPHCDQKFRTSGHRKSHIAAHFRTETPKKRRTSVRGSELQNEINNTAGSAQAGGVLPGMDQALLQNQSLIPVSLSLGDQLSALTDSTATTQMLQGLEGVQLQLTGAVGQGIQITGLDPSLITQTVQIDASLLQQLQQQGNLNITINPSILTADPHLVQQSALQPDPSNNVLIQPVTVAPVGQEVVSDPGPGQPMLSMTSDQAVGQEVSADQDTDVGVPEGVSEDTLDHLENPGIIVSSASQANHTVGQEPLLTQNSSVDMHQMPIQINAVSVDGTVRVITDRKHSCPVCHKAFKRAGHLKDHMVMHNPEDVKQQVRPTPHKCKFCEKAFHKPSQLERHTRIHTGERPFVCEICDKAFNQKNALQIHLKKHSGERPHRCGYCGMAFTQKGNLKIHIKRLHHKDMVDSMNLSAASAAAMVDADSSLTHSFTTAHDNEAQGQGDTTTDLDGVVTEFLLHE